MQSYDALHSGARVRKGQGSLIRPCEPVDIYATTMRLFKQGFLKKNHMRVLAHYGETLTPPNPRDYEQAPDYELWQQAMQKLETPLRRKGIIVRYDDE